jgi:hypothetical protein
MDFQYHADQEWACSSLAVVPLESPSVALAAPRTSESATSTTRRGERRDPSAGASSRSSVSAFEQTAARARRLRRTPARGGRDVAQGARGSQSWLAVHVPRRAGQYRDIVLFGSVMVDTTSELFQT